MADTPTPDERGRPSRSPSRGGAGKSRPKRAKDGTVPVAKEAIAAAAEGLGGVERIIAWAQEDSQNEGAFWKTIYPRLIGVDPKTDAGERPARALTWKPPT